MAAGYRSLLNWWMGGQGKGTAAEVTFIPVTMSHLEGTRIGSRHLEGRSIGSRHLEGVRIGSRHLEGNKI